MVQKVEQSQVPKSATYAAPVVSSARPQSAASIEQAVEVEDHDPEGVVVVQGTTCKRKGCGYAFKSAVLSQNEGSEAECVYHPGSPIFHEGSKGWSCCSRKVLEFDEFLKIKGCKQGKHLFVGTLNEEKVKKNEPVCRHDWFQSPSEVVLSIYAKKVETEKAKIEFTEQHVRQCLSFFNKCCLNS